MKRAVLVLNGSSVFLILFVILILRGANPFVALQLVQMLVLLETLMYAALAVAVIAIIISSIIIIKGVSEKAA